ncbi:SseB family protein [Ileibacterium valens]|uniref:SseB family protein n=1 Tax=Ileibacterium valens TaxID=1862668 RepID=UPI00272A6013|nr:SseB family protein [Ileibacterium valens]
MSMNFLTPIPEPQQIDNSDLEDIILRLEKDRTHENLETLIRTLQRKMINQGLLLIPVSDQYEQESPKADLFRLDKVSVDDLTRGSDLREAVPRTVELARGGQALAAFTSKNEFQKGEASKYTAVLLKEFLEYAIQSENLQGIVLNPWDVSVLIDRKLIAQLLDLAAATQIRSGIYLIKSVPKDLHPDVQGCFITESLEPADSFSAQLLEPMKPALEELKQNVPFLNVGNTILLEPGDHCDHTSSILLMVAPVSGIEPMYEETAISEIYLHAMNETSKAGYKSVVLPAMSEESFGIPLTKSIPSTLLALSAWCSSHPKEAVEIFIQIPQKAVFDQYLGYLHEMENGGNETMGQVD